MADLWYYTSEGKPMDPVSTVELQQLARAGYLKPTDLVWQDGMPEWAPASKTTGLFDEAAAATVVPPTAADRFETPAEGPRSKHRFTDSDRDEHDRPRRQALRKEGLSTGGVIGIVVGVGVLLIAILVGAVLLFNGSRRDQVRIVQQGVVVKDMAKDGGPPNFRPPQQPPKAWPPKAGKGGVNWPKDRINVDGRPINPAIRPPNSPALGQPRVVPDKGLAITDELTNADPTDPVRQLVACKVYPIQLTAGRTYVIDMQSVDFDSYLRVEDSQFINLAEDDDGGGNLNARIFFVPRETATYRVIATSFEPAQGRFTLRIRPD